MNNNTILSVVIPVYNTENYLVRLINSFINQDVDSNVEYIFVDDGSTDKSAGIIKNYSQKNSSIKYIYQNNSGAPKARNNGIRNAKGSYIYFVDSDDQLASETIKNIIEIIKGHSPELILGSYRLIDTKGKIKKPKYKKTGVIEMSSNFQEIITLPPMIGNKIFKKSIIEENYLEFSDYKIGQDLNFYLKYLSNIKKIFITNDTFYIYHMRNDSISTTYGKNILEIIDSVENAENYLKQKGNIERDQLSDAFNIIKYGNYYLQYSKTPFIKDSIDRKEVSDLLRNELLTLDLNIILKRKSLLTKIIALSKIYFKIFFKQK